MGTTARYGWPYPEVTDPPNTSLHLKNAEQAIETTVGGVADALAAFIATAPIGGEVVASGSAQTLAAGSNKLVFASVAVALNGVTWTGNDTFTVGSGGVYSVYAQCRKNAAAVQDAMAITTAPYADSTLLVPGLSSSGGYGDVFVSGTVYLAAGTPLSAYYYNGGSSAATYTTRYPKFKIWKVA
jgi:hypothetical protein